MGGFVVGNTELAVLEAVVTPLDEAPDLKIYDAKKHRSGATSPILR